MIKLSKSGNILPQYALKMVFTIKISLKLIFENGPGRKVSGHHYSSSWVSAGVGKRGHLPPSPSPLAVQNSTFLTLMNENSMFFT